MLFKVLQSLWNSFPPAGRAGPNTIGGDSIPDLHVADGVVFHRAGDLVKAEAAYRNALHFNPRNVDALHLLGVLSYRRGDLDQAETLVRDALNLRPGSHEILNTFAGVLTSMGRHAEAEHALSEALTQNPQAYKARANLLFLLNIIPGVTRERLFAEHVEWGLRHAPSIKYENPQRFGDLDQQEAPAPSRLRIGYVSADFCNHPVGRIISAVLPHHDRDRFEIFCYDNGSEQDEVNSVLRRYAEHWMDVQPMNDEALAARIRSDQIQILVDLSGHTRNHRLTLFALKPAPVQATWLGYLNTTGVQAIDWRITDQKADPAPGAQQWHVERLWYLPDCLWPWQAPVTQIPLVPESPWVKAGHITFGSFNTFRKINDKVILVWSQILKRIPDARLRVYGAPRGRAVDRVYDLFEANQIDSSRIDLFSPIEYQRYLRAYRDIDISLDPFPYNGGATTCESLWMGVPVVSLAGAGGFARSGASILGATKLDELVASSEAEYVDIASRLAKDLKGLSKMRAHLREQFLSSPISNSLGFSKNLEAAYQGMWVDYEDRVSNVGIQQVRDV
jgi:protein O-GlcNAc transferase